MRGGKNIKLFLSSLPIPKTNRYIRRKNGQVFRSPKVLMWESRALWELQTQYKGPPLNFPLSVEVYFFLSDKRKRDIDNMLKTLWDVLEKAQIIENDNLIYETHTVKITGETVTGTVINIKPFKRKETLLLKLKKELREFKNKTG